MSVSALSAPGTAAMVAFGAKDNPKAQEETTVTRAFESRHIPRLVELVSSADLVIRQKALSTLGSECANPKGAVTALAEGAVAVLLSCLMDPDTIVRRDALIALRTLVRYRGADESLSCNTKSLRSIAGALNDSSPPVRQHALETLGGAVERPGGAAAAVDMDLVPTVLKFLERADVDSKQKSLGLVLLKECIVRVPTACQVALEGEVLPLVTRLLAAGHLEDGGHQASAREAEKTRQDGEEAVQVGVNAAKVIGALTVCMTGKVAATEHPGLIAGLLAGIRERCERELQAACAGSLGLIVVYKEAKMAVVREEEGSIDSVLGLLGVDDESVVLAGLGLVAALAEDPQGRRELNDPQRGVVALLKSLAGEGESRHAKPVSRPASGSTLERTGGSPMRVTFTPDMEATAEPDDVGQTLATSDLGLFVARAAKRALAVVQWTT